MRHRIAALAVPALLLHLLPAQLLGAGDHGTLVVLNKAEATASLIDLASGAVAATLPTGEGPHEGVVSPDGRLAVVTNYGTRENPGSSLTVLDIPGAEVVRTIDLGEYRRPHGIAWLSDGPRVVVTAEENQALLTVDVVEGTIVGAVETGQDVSHMVVVSPDGKRAFVANIRSGSMTAIDLEAGTHLANVETGDGAEGIDITPDGSHVWVTNRGADTVSIVDAATLEIVATLESKSFPIRAAMTPDGKWVLISNARTGDLAVFDVAKQVEARRLVLDLEATETEGRLFGGSFGNSSVPIGIVVRPDGKRAYVAHTNADVISVLDLEKWASVGTLRAGKEPDGMAFSPLTVEKQPTPPEPEKADAPEQEGTP